MVQFDLLTVLIVAVSVEIITIIARYFMRLNSRNIIKKHSKYLGFKKMIHFHHLFIGIIISIIFYFLNNSFWFNFGIGVAVSDLFHHFVFLIKVRNDPEFKIIEERN